MIVKSTSAFRKSASELSKRKKNQYHTCLSDVCSELNSCSLEEQITANDQIFVKPTAALIKMRVASAVRKEGKSGGYRAIVYCDRAKGEAHLLEIYPKTGRFAKADQTDKEREEMLVMYIAERNSGLLEEHDLKNKLKLKTAKPVAAD